MRSVIYLSLIVLFVFGAFDALAAQICPTVGVTYLVRGDDGQLLSAADLTAIIRHFPPVTEPGSTSRQTPERNVVVGVDRIFLNEDGTLPATEESVQRAISNPTMALRFASGGCEMHFGEVVLTHQGKTMRLIFNIDLGGTMNGRFSQRQRPVIDSVPFQEGTFILDVKLEALKTVSIPNDLNMQGIDVLVPAQSWKKVK
jgi:hypothetical protein